MTKEAPTPSEHGWTAFHAPWKVVERTEKDGSTSYHVCNKDGAVWLSSDKRSLAEFQVNEWNDEAALYWMQAP